jgi:hypothetical protein
MATIANRTEARAWPPLSAGERRQACVIADLVRRRRGMGRGEGTIWAEARRLWQADPNIFAAAELLAEVRRDGWPPT